MVLAGIAILFASPLINWLAVMNQKMDLPESLSGIEAWMRSSEEAAAEMTKAFTAGTSVGVLISNLFVVAFMAALSEELFFRGVVQKVSIECFKNPHAGIWFGAILFSAFHMQFYGFLPRMLMGSFLGYFFWWSGSLWPSILAHFINNGSAVFVTWLINRGQLDATAETLGTQSADTIYVIVSAVLVIACLVLIRLLERKRRNNGGHTLHTSSQ
jgi:membrane protease YdiL (CAAX protease family)